MTGITDTGEGRMRLRSAPLHTSATPTHSYLLTETAAEFPSTAWPMISTAMLTCARENEAIADMVAQERNSTLNALRARTERGIADRQLVDETDAASLARFVGAIIQGMSVQARDEATEAELLAIAHLAIKTGAWLPCLGSIPSDRLMITAGWRKHRLASSIAFRREQH